MVDFSKFLKANDKRTPEEKAEAERKTWEDYSEKLRQRIELASKPVNRLEDALNEGFFHGDHYAESFILSQIRRRDDSGISGTKGVGLLDLTEKQRSYSDGLIRKLDALDQTHSEKPSEPKP